jgi:hypothetical protein
VGGTFLGYTARGRLVKALHVPDPMIAIPEDVIAVALGLFAASRL